MTDWNNSEILIYQSENGVTKIDVTFKEGKRELSRELPFYNLDMIISLVYRIKSIFWCKSVIWRKRKKSNYWEVL